MGWYDKRKDLNVLIGRVLSDVRNVDDVITFDVLGGGQYQMYHAQDCCESVGVEDIAGDLKDLIGSPILQAEEVSSEGELARDEYEESYTWTFYKLATIKGSVTIRWYGSSNGYYSESVDFVETQAPAVKPEEGDGGIVADETRGGS
jgi:hypothetical protein